MNLVWFILMIIMMSCSTHQKVIIVRETKPVSICDNKIPADVYSIMFSRTDKDVMSYLKGNNIYPNARGVFCGTLIHEATKRKKLNLVKELINYGVLWDEKDEFGNTPLAEAVRNSDIKLTKFFLEKDSRTNLNYSFNNSLLFMALDSNSFEILDLLIKYKVCPFGKGFMKDSIESTWASEGLKKRAIDYRNSYKKMYGDCKIITNDRN